MDIQSGNNDKLHLVMTFLSLNASQKTQQTEKEKWDLKGMTHDCVSVFKLKYTNNISDELFSWQSPHETVPTHRCGFLIFLIYVHAFHTMCITICWL